MIPGIDLIDFIKFASVFGVLAIVFAETGLMIGFFLPGDSMLFTAGFLTASHVLNININLLVALIFLAAVLGNSTGYTLGRRIGPQIFKKPDARFFKQEYVQRAHDFYEKNGGKTIILAQFIPIIRTFAPVMAGVAKLEFRKFVAFNIIGAVFWTAGVTYAGYFLSKWFVSMGLSIDSVLLPIVILIIVLSISPAIFHVLKDKKQRQALWSATKLQFKVLFSKK
jgi:membrane-associated protein